MSDYQLPTSRPAPLPIGPGGNTTLLRELNEHNQNITMLNVQAQADTKYDPKPPARVTEAKFIEGFIGQPNLYTHLYVAGICFILYGLIAEK